MALSKEDKAEVAEMIAGVMESVHANSGVSKVKRMVAKLKGSYQLYILIILCIIFVGIKIPTLNTPYYWDEAWVYAPAIKAMAQNGISFFPNALSDWYSRGHPLLFVCTGAMWVKLFGQSLFSLHLFALVIALCFIFTLFYIIKKLFDSTLALIVTAITIAQPVFIAQSAITLPEIFLALWAILTMYHFVMKNKYYYFLFGTLMVLTKESGVAIIASLMLYQLICFFTQSITLNSLKLFIKNSLLALIPLIPFTAFLLVQHYQRGYYLFPEHIARLNFNWGNFQDTLRLCYYILFEEQGRLIITWSFLIVFGLLYKPVPVIIRLFIVAGLMTCVKIFFRYWTLPDWLMILFIGVFISMFYYFMHIKYTTDLKEAGKLLAILFITGLVYFVFSSVNFFTNRYLLLLIPFMVLYFSYYIKASLQFRSFLPYIWAMLIVSVMIYSGIVYCNNTGDVSPKYIQAVKLEQMIVKFMEEQNLQKNNIYCTFVIGNTLKDAGSGYLSGNATFANISAVFDKSTEYVIYTNIDYDPLWSKGSDTLPDFQLVKTFEYGITKGKVYKRIL